MTWLLAHLDGLIYWLAIVAGLVWWARSLRRPRASSLRPRTPAEDAELARLHSRLQYMRSEREAVRR